MAETKSSKTYFYGTGRRKTAVARVRLFLTGTGKITVNDVAVSQAEPLYIEPLKLVGKFGSTDLSIKVAGGGFNGQSEAIQHGIARALVEADPLFRTTLKKAGF